MDLDQYREESLETWDRFAANWDQQRRYLWEKTHPVSEAMVERLDPQPGDTVLELASGTGETSFLIAERVGEDGRVISTDFAPGMVGAARRRGEELGLSNLEHRVLDAEKMDLDDSSVDGVVARFGYMLMADPAAALAETRRVLRGGRRLSFAVWAGPERNMWAAVPGMVLVEAGHMPPPEPGAPGIFGMADPNRMRELVTGAGFGEPSIDEVPVVWGYVDAAEHWEKTNKLAAPIAEAVNALPPEEQERVRATVAERVEQLLAGDGSGINGMTYVVVAE
ncbi:MAG: methyltransferase protein [Solirubrobacterales bacterium]|nr:methyltransferase protein [Solirubrobacterales bacterium]